MISIPGYDVESPLGRGSQAQVYFGRSVATGTRVALKMLHTPTPAAATAARAEAALLAALDHPNLIALIEYLPVADTAVLVLELAEGGSLAELLVRRGRLSAPEVVAAVSPVAAALAHAHGEGLRHGDVSAANILFDRLGQPKLADLGVARLFDGASDWLGTPAYLDPTVAAGGVPGPASDVFALAAVALHAVTGHPPWQPPATESVITRATISRPDRPPTAEEILARAAAGRVPDLEHRLAGCPPELAAVLIRALDGDPNRRGTAAELALDLRASIRATSGVVLGGGRIVPSGRHSIEHRRADIERPSGADRPEFARPSDLAPSEGVPRSGRLVQVPADLTHLRRPIVRQSVPQASSGAASRRRRRPSGGWGRQRAVDARRTVLTVGVVGLAIAGTAAVALVAVAGRHADRAAAATAQPSAASVASTSGSAIDASPAQLLARLDAARSSAYAARDPGELAQVYRSAALLSADQAELLRSVPAGCRLTGLHTAYRSVTAVRSADGLAVRADVTVGAATLRCAAGVTSIAATPAQELAIELVGHGADVRIGAEQLVGNGNGNG